MAAKLPTVLEMLPQLTPDDLRVVANKAKAMMSLNGSGATALSPPIDYLLEGVYHELRARGVITQSQRLPASRIPSDFQQASLDVRKHLESHLPRLKAAEQAALGQLAAHCLARSLEAMRVPVTMHTMLRCIDRVPLALDMSFPGYLRAGLLASCWTVRGGPR